MHNQAKGQVFVMWVIWFALLSGVFVIRTVIAPPHSASSGELWQLALLPVFFATVIRWFVLPRVTTFQRVMPVFIVGMAMSESACIVGMFVFSDHVSELFNFGVVSMLQFIPLYARGIADGNE